MRSIVTEVFKYSELSPDAQSRAREWFRQGLEFDTEFVIKDAQMIGEMLGVEFATCRGSSRARPSIYWSGFWSQGDGACFDGSWSYAKGSTRAIREHAPRDAELHRIADALQRAARVSFYSVSASCTVTRGNNMRVSCDDCTREVEDVISQALQDFAHWIYRQLETEYDYQTSDDQVSEMIEANGYEFDETGKPV